MENIYRDIAERTNGEIYVGVVGPVRTGKSTLIKKFMEKLVMPNIENAYDRERARDEMPQSAAGKTVMTTEPKFIPDEAVEVTLDDNAHLKVKVIDCVGYIVPDALGQFENGQPRMVNTPWREEPMPFKEAAEFGTKKVITDHSTIGMLVTCDGTICDIPRESYVEAEEKVVSELKAINKPFAIVLNSARPNDPKAVELALELEEKYDAPVALVNCLELEAEDIKHILALILMEFPIKEVAVKLPAWTNALDNNHWLIKNLHDAIMLNAGKASKMEDVKETFSKISSDYITAARVDEMNLGNGNVEVALELNGDLYYRVLSELTGFEIATEEDLIRLMRELAEVKVKYDKVEQALSDVETKGYGIVMPEVGDLRLEEPEIVKQPGGYGVRLKAAAPSIHMIKADIETEINPMVGSEQQSEEFVRFLLNEFEEDRTKIWESNIFGKTLYELVTEGLHNKLSNMPDDARAKLSETLQRIINEGSGGLICIIL